MIARIPGRGGVPAGARAGLAVAALLGLAAAGRPCRAGEALDLEQCFRLAAAGYPGLAAARAATAAAEAEARAARADLAPRLDARGAWTRLDKAPTAQFPSPVPGAPPVSVEIGEPDSHEVGLSAGWLAYAGGSLAERSRIAGLGADEARRQEDAGRSDLLLQVARTYYGLLAAGRRRSLLEEERHRVGEHRNLAQVFFEQGVVPRNDVLKAEVALSRIEWESVQAAAEERLAASRLDVLLGRAPDAPVAVREVPEGELPPPAPPRSSALALMRENRAELAAARLREEQARRAVRAAEGGWYPRLSLGADYTLAADGGFAAGEAGGWGLGAQATWKLIDFGRVRSEVARARALAEQAGADRALLEQGLALELEQALLGKDTAEKELEVARKGLLQAAENLRVAKELYRAAAGTNTDLLDAETDFTAAQTALHAAVYRGWAAEWGLRKALGTMPDPGKEPDTR